VSVDLTRGKVIDFGGKALDKWEKVAKLPLPKRLQAYHEAHKEMAAGSNHGVPPITNMLTDILEAIVIIGDIVAHFPEPWQLQELIRESVVDSEPVALFRRHPYVADSVEEGVGCQAMVGPEGELCGLPRKSSLHRLPGAPR
jgi:hypothetical protein